ncbi:hypothetical protein H1V43_20915 [Streptomyces sp. PSKA54]|uniref:Uncharacterized protein n=1 Tax=Streptomyces himalayensis subsp. aureolus TaxID=2758039 RepID=A0A7W2HHG8_9ACTN|nr:hypothetical protein [Streptomyces himalayensis]MBA4863789.1 hypothetical protein [Streptomyces himalayensis subsp. aureolus]
MDIMTRVRSQWDRLTAAGTGAAGGVVLIVGWHGVSGTPYPAEQLPYLASAGLGGLFLLGISTALWLSADLRDEWRKLDRIEQALRAADGPGALEQGRASAGSGLDRTGTAVASPGPPPAPAPAPTGDNR